MKRAFHRYFGQQMLKCLLFRKGEEYKQGDIKWTEKKNGANR